MLKIDRGRVAFSRLDNRSLDVLKITERYDLQQMIANSPADFFGEIGEQLLLLGQEIRPSPVVDDRIDLLALDSSGAVVVIELKRGSHKLQLLQSLSYAAMISSWSADELVGIRVKSTGKSAEDVNAELEDFLLEEHEAINARQRVILIAEAFDYAVLATAEWLSERHDADIQCHKLVVTIDGENEYVGCVRLYPPSDIGQEAVRRGPRAPGQPLKSGKWKDWDDAIAAIGNDAVRGFFREEIDAKRDAYLRKRVLRFHYNGRRRWWAAARNDLAYVWQNGRFEDDLDFWRTRLSDLGDVGEVKDSACLRLFLRTPNDFAAFRAAVGGGNVFAFAAGKAAGDADDIDADE